MDQKALDAGIGDVPSHTVDINVQNGGHRRHHAPPANVFRPYVGGDALAASQIGQKPSTAISTTAPTFSGHIVSEIRAG